MNYKEDSKPDFQALWNEWKKETRPALVENLGYKLNIDLFMLEYIGCAWSIEHFAWAFRLWKNEKIVGIRLINAVGHKWVVRGSEDGSLLDGIPANEDMQKVLNILDYKL